MLFYLMYLDPLADPVCNQGGHVSTLKLKKKKISIYKLKKYGFTKLLTFIFVLNSHFHFIKKKKIKGDKSIKITANISNNPKLQYSPYITNNQIT